MERLGDANIKETNPVQTLYEIWFGFLVSVFLECTVDASAAMEHSPEESLNDISGHKDAGGSRTLG